MDTKQAYKEKLEAQLERARAELDALKASVKGMTADAKTAAAEQIEALEYTVCCLSVYSSTLAKTSGRASSRV